MEIQHGNQRSRYCDGIHRRDFLKIGALSFLGLSLPDLLRAEQNAARSDRSCILFFQNGGPSHIDMWDPKPDAPAEYRGTFGTVETSVSGIRISDRLPLSARQMDKFAILRSVTHPDGGHLRATHLMMTGYLPSKGVPGGSAYNENPALGAVVAHEQGARNGVPPYVVLPRPLGQGNAAYLGASCNPFLIEGDPNAAGFSVRDISLPKGITTARLEDRRRLLQALDRYRRDHESLEVIAGVDSYYEQAYQMITGPNTQKAFDIQQEPEGIRELYGRTTLGQSALMARRLVEAGVRCVTIASGGWDTHNKNFDSLDRRLPETDRAFAALIQDLHQRGMLETTMVVMMGEFGRTPKINKNAGRDHWPNCLSVVMAGGGLRGGQTVGTSDAHGEGPKDRPIHPEDVLATVYRQMGVDFDKEFRNTQDRPIKIVRNGEPIRELL